MHRNNITHLEKICIEAGEEGVLQDAVRAAFSDAKAAKSA